MRDFTTAPSLSPHWLAVSFSPSLSIVSPICLHVCLHTSCSLIKHSPAGRGKGSREVLATHEIVEGRVDMLVRMGLVSSIFVGAMHICIYTAQAMHNAHLHATSHTLYQQPHQITIMCSPFNFKWVMGEVISQVNYSPSSISANKYCFSALFFFQDIYC